MNARLPLCLPPAESIVKVLKLQHVCLMGQIAGNSIKMSLPVTGYTLTELRSLVATKLMQL
jgi:hypothetical protein